MTDDTSQPLYSLAHLTLINATAPELIYIAARAGYDAVSPRFIQMNVPGEFRESPINKAMVAAVVRRRKLYRQLSGTEVPWFPHDNDMELL